jgi:hypothetical protein
MWLQTFQGKHILPKRQLSIIAQSFARKTPEVNRVKTQDTEEQKVCGSNTWLEIRIVRLREFLLAYKLVLQPLT